MATSPRNSESSAHSSVASPTTMSSISVSENLQTPPFPSSPTPSAAKARPDIDHRASTLRASVFDVFAELGAFDENSQIAEWIFNPNVDDAAFASSSAGPRKVNVHFLEKSGSRFRERLNSDGSANLLNGYTSRVKPFASSPSPSTSPMPTRRPPMRFFNGLRARSASRNRRDKRRSPEETIVEEPITTVSPSKKRPFLQYLPRPGYLGEMRSASSPVTVVLGHTSSPSIATNASWEHIQGSASLDLLRSTDISPVNTFLHGKHSPAPGIPFPSQRESGGGSLFLKKISTAVARPFSAASTNHPDTDTSVMKRASYQINPIRRTRSRPPEATETLKVTPLRTKFPSSFSSPSSPTDVSPTTRALATMDVL
ncbi:hypothetical protein DFJ43DRAFT_1224626 [Lentinula guzmanii]|uniref:Uncharacterized protein n=1 Tax=Lentinula guzmanii TaxID=2804957 RepID=A0AA38J981_9AGAR|nr:hypothetical protein DFJ43DRAFT_1224626 [Lentinula guzmanii]